MRYVQNAKKPSETQAYLLTYLLDRENSDTDVNILNWRFNHIFLVGRPGAVVKGVGHISTNL